MRLDGKTAVVTGAASGIGLATAQCLSDAGAHVLIGDIAAEKGQEAAARLRSAQRQADYLPLDVTDDASIASFAAAAGKVDIVVNAAGWGKIEFFLQNELSFW